MAEDKKITQFDPMTQSGPNDELPIVNMVGVPVTESITTTNLFASPQPIGGGINGHPNTGEFTSLVLPDGATINEFSIDGTLADNLNTSVPTEKAVKKYVDDSIFNLNPDKIWEGDSSVEVVDDGTTAGYVTIVADGTEVAYFDAEASTQRIGKASGAGRLEISDTTIVASVGSVDIMTLAETSQQFGISTSSYFNINQSTNVITINANTTEVANFTVDGLTLESGVSIDEFSIDGTLVDNSDDAVPTEKAVKTYVDTAISNFTPDKIWEGDSYVEVVDDGTTAGYVTIVADGAEVAHFDDTGLTLESGATVNEFSIDGTLAGDSDIAVPTEKAIKTYVDTSISNIAHDKIYEGDSYVEVVDTGVGYVTIVADTVEVGRFDVSTQRIGASGDTTISLDQTTDQITITADGDSQILVETTGVTVYKNLIVSGDLYVDGTTWVVHDQEVTTSDNMIVINYGEIGPGVTSGFAGFEIDRGTLTNYRFIFEESSDTFRIGEVGSLQAVATREDEPVENNVAWWNDSDSRFDTQGNTFINIDQTSGSIVITDNSVEAMTIDENGLALENGATVDEFSTDGTLADDSDTAVPTEQAVKTYVDSGDTSTLNSANSYTDIEIANLKSEVDLINTQHVNSDSTAVTGDVLLIDTSASDVTITFQRSLDAKILVKKIKAENTLYIQADGGLIDGLAQKTITTLYESFTYISDGDNFYIF